MPLSALVDVLQYKECRKASLAVLVKLYRRIILRLVTAESPDHLSYGIMRLLHGIFMP